jgi:hypothetical protein
MSIHDLPTMRRGDGRRTAPPSIVAWCEPQMVQRVTRLLGQTSLVSTSWTEISTASASASCIFVARRVIGDDRDSVQRLASLRRSRPLCPVVVAAEMSEANINHLLTALPSRFIAIENIERSIRSVLDEVTATGHRSLIARALSFRARSHELRSVVTLLFDRGTVPNSDLELAELVGCNVLKLRRHCQGEFGFTVFQLRRWARLFLALELWSNGIRHPEIGSC